MTEYLETATTAPGEPFYTGIAPAAEEIDYSLPVSISGRGFLVDRSPSLPTSMRHSRQSIDLLNTQNATNGEDLSFTSPEVWRRTVESWHFGAGQSRFDRTNGLPYRFADSHNVDVWDEWKVSLLPGTELLQALAPGKAHLTTVGEDRFVAIVGTTSYWWSDLDLAPVVLAMPNTVLDVCSDGKNLYTVDTLGNLIRYSGPSAGTVITAIPNFDTARAFIGYVKGFIVAAGGEYLYDMTTGSPTLIYQHPLETFTWVDSCEGLGPAYLIGGVGDKWHVYRMSINDLATTFDPPVSAAPVPEGEIAYALGSYLGYVLIGTSGGWRFGIPSGDGSLSFGRLVETSAPVQCFEGQDRFVWYGQSGGPAGLGRADLAQFVAPMTPAYANDLRTDEAGVVSGVITFGAGGGGLGRRVFVIEGVGVFGESLDLAESGWIEQGSMTFNSADLKMAMYLQVNHEPLPLNSEVRAEVKFDSSGWNEVGVQDTAESFTLGNLPLRTRFNLANVRITLTRSSTDPTLGPALTRIEFRALNIPGRATEFRIPLILRSSIYFDERTDLRDPADDYQFLIDLWQTREPFVYREAGLTFDLHLTDFLWLPEQTTDNGSAYEGLIVLTAKEIQ